MRKKIIIANWKMNKTIAEVSYFLQTSIPELAQLRGTDVVAGVAPVALHLHKVREATSQTKLLTVAQDAHFEPNGAFTGCISYTQLKDAGIDYVIVGHSERRTLFHETDEQINKKVVALVASNMIPVLCVGESLQQYEAGQTRQVIDQQLTKALAGIPAERAASVVVAYEPVWAIGTGKTATAEVAQSVIAFIRQRVGQLFNEGVAKKILIQYGGSVKPENIKQICSQPDIDGALVGSAALDPTSFVAMLKALT